jgi:hypothetical protein
MSVELVASLGKPVTLDAVLRSGRQVVSDLLGAAAPDLVVFADRRYHQGERTDDGRRLTTAELKETVVGNRIPPAADGLVGSLHFDIDVPATGDGVFLMVVDHQGDGLDDGRHAVFTPYRTCVGVAVAVSLALATAGLAGGRYVDEQIGMVTPAEDEPDEVINRTRLAERGQDFAFQCERYLRQFPHLNGWPRDRATR